MILKIRKKSEESPPKIAEMNRRVVKILNAGLCEVIDKWCETYGLMYRRHRITFSPDNFTTRLDIVLKHREKENRMHNAESYRPHDCQYKVGDLVSCGRDTKTVYEVVDFTRRGNVLIKRVSDGKRFRAKPHALHEPYGGN